MSQALRTGGLTVALVWGLLATQTARAEHVNAIVINGVISAATADFVERALAESEEQGAVALLIAIDTPGGVLEPTKFIVQSLLNAQIPTIVYVSPQGAWAASAVARLSPPNVASSTRPITSTTSTSPGRRKSITRCVVPGPKPAALASASITSSTSGRRGRNSAVTARPTSRFSGCRTFQPDEY